MDEHELGRMVMRAMEAADEGLEAAAERLMERLARDPRCLLALDWLADRPDEARRLAGGEAEAVGLLRLHLAYRYGPREAD